MGDEGSKVGPPVSDEDYMLASNDVRVSVMISMLREIDLGPDVKADELTVVAEVLWQWSKRFDARRDARNHPGEPDRRAAARERGEARVADLVASRKDATEQPGVAPWDGSVVVVVNGVRFPGGHPVVRSEDLMPGYTFRRGTDEWVAVKQVSRFPGGWLCALRPDYQVTEWFDAAEIAIQGEPVPWRADDQYAIDAYGSESKW